MAFQFPWTNLHELNLDWFLSKFKQFTDNFLGTTATAESVPYGTQPSVTVTGGELDDDTDIVDPFTFNFKIPAGAQGVPGTPGAPGAPGAPGQDGFSPIATVTKSGTVATITITDVNGTTTTTISDGEVTQAQLDTKAPAIMLTASGSMASFSDGADDLPVTDLVVNIEPVQDLSNGDPSPTNICPITGWTKANLTRWGGNLLPDVSRNSSGYAVTVKFEGNKGTLTGTANSSGGRNVFRSDYFSLKAGTYYFKRFNVNDNGNSVPAVYVQNNTSIISVNGTTGQFTLSADSTLMNLGFNVTSGQVYNYSALFVIATTNISAYEPYTSSTLTIDWTTEAGTVYGGSLDVTTGVLTVTDGYIASYNGETLPSTWISDRDVYAPGTTPTTGAEVVYKLATSQTYQLTPHQINTMLGNNNIRADCGNTTVEYTADTKLYIENLTQPTEDDMIANTSIANGKFFMIGNNLYRATTAIASGSQIIPGTNATALSLADALNLL